MLIYDHAARLARHSEKVNLLLTFLASGEVWTTLENAASLWTISTDAAATTLKSMVREHLIVREDIAAGVKAKIAIYGLTPDGIAVCDSAPANTIEHQIGRLTSTNIPHSLATQRVRIVAEAAGWTDWQPGRNFYCKGFPVVPDAVGTDKNGKRVAIEVERNVKSLKRRREVLSGHVLMIAQHRMYDRVLYVCDARCNSTRLKELYLSLDEIQTPAGRTMMTDMHRSRFDFIDISSFKG